MKIRLDYVSNSSSSSFMLVGDAFDSDAIIKAWQKMHSDSLETEDGAGDLAYAIANELGLECERGLDRYYDMWVIGLSFDAMKDNETKNQFKDRITVALTKAFDDVQVSTCIDGGYDG